MQNKPAQGKRGTSAGVGKPSFLDKALKGHDNLVSSFINKVTAKDAKGAEEDGGFALQIFASVALFAVIFLRSSSF